MDFAIILTSLATMVTIIGFVYGFIRNFKDDMRAFKDDIKIDINGHIDRLEKRMELSEKRMEQSIELSEKRMEQSIELSEKRMNQFETKMTSLEERFESRMISLEERMFWILTGKKLEDAILEERMKKPKTDP